MSLVTKFAKAARDTAINAADMIATGFLTTGYTMAGDAKGIIQVNEALTQRIRARKTARHAQ